MDLNQQNLKDKLQEDMKSAMRAQTSESKARLQVIRLMLAAIKQQEVDKRISLNNEQIIEILDKMTKQRRESISQFKAANREDLVSKENAELDIINEFLPAKLSTDELKVLIKNTLSELQAKSMADMGKIMQSLRPQLIGRADMDVVSKLLKEQLAANN
jgi:uncharacterized protein YqeY